MASEIKLILADKSESVISTYQKYFYYDKNVETKKKDVRELEGYDCLILPSSSGFGIQHSTGFVRELITYIFFCISIFCFFFQPTVGSKNVFSFSIVRKLGKMLRFLQKIISFFF
jgi:hypothetical protein